MAEIHLSESRVPKYVEAGRSVEGELGDRRSPEPTRMVGWNGRQEIHGIRAATFRRRKHLSRKTSCSLRTKLAVVNLFFLKMGW